MAAPEELVLCPKIDDKFYFLSAFIDVSEQFYGWILGFGRRIKLIGNEEVVKEFNKLPQQQWN